MQDPFLKRWVIRYSFVPCINQVDLEGIIHVSVRKRAIHCGPVAFAVYAQSPWPHLNGGQTKGGIFAGLLAFLTLFFSRVSPVRLYIPHGRHVSVADFSLSAWVARLSSSPCYSCSRPTVRVTENWTAR